jgi:serine/threonine protein kinase
MAARTPTRYGRYEVLAPLATGGMADLFLARARGFDGFELLAVVKRIRPHLAANPQFVRLFLDEARLAATLRHPNVVHVHDAGQERGEYFFVMEYVHGRDLRAVLDGCVGRGRVISFDEALSIAVGVCAGLHHAHERTDAQGRALGIVHRDISPSNVLVGFEGGVKLADFGIAKATQAVGNKEQATGSLRGKLSYMSPEQCLGQPLDRRADLYALAVVLYELTTGARPFGEAPSEFLALKRTLEAPVRPPSTLRPGYPPELERIVLRGLARDRAERYATAQALQLDLEDFARRHQMALSPLTLTRLMETLFAGELGAWHAAQSRGVALGQHLTESHTHSLEEAVAALRPAQLQGLRAAPSESLAMAPRSDAITTAAELSEASSAPLAEAETLRRPSAARRRRQLVGWAALLTAAGALAFVVGLRAGRAPHPLAIDASPVATAAPVAATAPMATGGPLHAPLAEDAAPARVAATPSTHATTSAHPHLVKADKAAARPHARPARASARTPAGARGPAWDPEAPLLPR